MLALVPAGIALLFVRAAWQETASALAGGGSPALGCVLDCTADRVLRASSDLGRLGAIHGFGIERRGAFVVVAMLADQLNPVPLLGRLTDLQALELAEAAAAFVGVAATVVE